MWEAGRAAVPLSQAKLFFLAIAELFGQQPTSYADCSMPSQPRVTQSVMTDEYSIVY